MQIYYLVDNWLCGPVAKEKLQELLDSGKLGREAPVWTPAAETWASAAEIFAPVDETCFYNMEDSGFMHTRQVVEQLGRLDLPPPRDLLALRLARDQALITRDQADRCLAELVEGKSRSVPMPARLHSMGWITAGQRAALETVMSRDAIPKVIGGYEILEELGHGGMGSTYKARQTAMDRIVALKVLLPKFSQDAEYVRRFEREAKMAARLNHPGIATAYEVGSAGGQHYFSMEFVEGKTLDRLMEEKDDFTEEEARDVVVQVCAALQHAWGHEMVHRDISPRNIIVTPSGAVKLIDMGLTKCTGPDASGFTTVGVTVGTPAYISPEQGAGKDDTDIRSDIYSLGCVLYEMMGGVPPLLGETVLETITNHIRSSVPPLREVRLDASDLMCHMVQKMTAMDRADRFQTPQEVMEGFDADDVTVRLSLQTFAALPPIGKQIEGWREGQEGELLLDVRDREYTHLIARELERRLEASGADPEFQGYAQTIFAELAANAFDHGCKGLERGTIRLRLESNSAFFRLEVIDPGPGFPARQMLEKIRGEPLDRERRRGLIQVLNIADLLTYSESGNHVKAVLYRKSKGSGVLSREAEGILYVEIKGKGDLALAEEFRRWVENFSLSAPRRICLMVCTDWVSSMFVGAIGKLQSKAKDSGSVLAVWAEHQSCYRIMQQLGIGSFVRVYDSLETAEFSLRLAGLAGEGGAEESVSDDRQDAAPAEKAEAPRLRHAPAAEGQARSPERKNHGSDSQRRRARPEVEAEDKKSMLDRFLKKFWK